MNWVGDEAVLHTLTARRAKRRGRRLRLCATHVTEHALAGIIVGAGFGFSSGRLCRFGFRIGVHVVQRNHTVPWVTCLEPHDAKHHSHRNHATNATGPNQCRSARHRAR
jgi:hypothetical protein